MTPTEALVTGALTGLVMREIAGGNPSGIKFHSVMGEIADDGDYKSVMTLHMESGASVRIIVAEV